MSAIFEWFLGGSMLGVKEGLELGTPEGVEGGWVDDEAALGFFVDEAALGFFVEGRFVKEGPTLLA